MSKRDYEYVSLHPARLNLLDLINIVGRASIPATLFYDIEMSFDAVAGKDTILLRGGRRDNSSRSSNECTK